MEFEYIKDCFSPGFSSIRTVWKNIKTGNYYISIADQEPVKSQIDTRYMIFKEPIKMSLDIVDLEQIIIYKI